MITTTDLNEYRSLKSTISVKRHLLKRKIQDVIRAEETVVMIQDEIEILRHRRQQLRRRGAY